jgi:hypothetical protein
MQEHNIQYIKTLSYSPESNGLVEGKNKIVRKMLREIMIRNNNRNWSNHLGTVETLMNSIVNTTTKRAPNDIWTAGHPLQGEVNQDVVARHKSRVVNAIKNNSTTEYKVGDYVRVKLGTLYSSVRKIIKSGDKKLLVVNYSPTIYRIHSILRKDRADRRVGDTVISYEKSRYTLDNMDGTPLQTQEKLNNPNAIRQRKRFFASDMILVPQPDNDETYLSGFTIKDALRLNKMDKQNPVALQRAEPRPRPIVRAILPIPAPRPAQPRPEPRPAPAPKPDLIGKYIQKKFKGYGNTIFKGKIMSYDAIRKFYTVQYEDKSIEEYTRAQINKFIIPLLNGAGLQYVIIGGHSHILQ